MGFGCVRSFIPTLAGVHGVSDPCRTPESKQRVQSIALIQLADSYR